jgi:hypothetical protein
MGANREDEDMPLNLSLKPETVVRPSAHFLYLQRTGPFSETAPPAWSELFRLLARRVSHEQFTELLGLSRIDGSKQGAFEQRFRALAASKTSVREEYCIEKYLNDPKVTPEDRLQTQILIPIS